MSVSRPVQNGIGMTVHTNRVDSKVSADTPGSVGEFACPRPYERKGMLALSNPPGFLVAARPALQYFTFNLTPEPNLNSSFKRTTYSPANRTSESIHPANNKRKSYLTR